MKLDEINFRDGNSWTSLKDLIYPVGSIYMNASKTDNPGNTIGGTWAKIESRFLLGQGPSYAIGATGGKATHKLTINEIPSHNHSLENLNPITGDRCGWSYQEDTGDKLFYGRYAAARYITEFIGKNTANIGGGKLTTICHLIKSLLCGREQRSLLLGGVVA